MDDNKDQLGRKAYFTLKGYRRRTEGLKEFIIELERVYVKAKSYDMTVSDLGF